MCSPNGKLVVSVHCIERFSQRRLGIDITYSSFFKSPESVVDDYKRILLSAQERYFKKMLQENRLQEALDAFYRFYEDNRSLCLSTVGLLITALFQSPLTKELPRVQELFLKSKYSEYPKFEENVRYYRFENTIFVVRPGEIITCFELETDTQHILEFLEKGMPIPVF